MTDEEKARSRRRLADVTAQMEKLSAERDQLIVEQLSFGDSQRAVGARAHMSHNGVAKVVRRLEVAA